MWTYDLGDSARASTGPSRMAGEVGSAVCLSSFYNAEAIGAGSLAELPFAIRQRAESIGR